MLDIFAMCIPAALAKARLRVCLRYILLLEISVFYYWRLILITVWESGTNQMWRQKPLLWMWSPIWTISWIKWILYIWLRIIGLIWVILLLPCAEGIWQLHKIWVLKNFWQGFPFICLFLSHCQDLIINSQSSV